MKRTLLICTVLSLLMHSWLMAQDSTSHFPLNSVSIDGIFNYSIGKNLNSKSYNFQDGKLTRRQNIFTIGGRVSYIRHLNKKYGLGIEYVFESTTVPLRPTLLYEYVQGAYTRQTMRQYENISLQSHGVFLKNEWQWTNKKGRLHFVYQLGIGAIFSEIVDKPYHFEEISEVYDLTSPMGTESTFHSVDEGYDTRPLFETTTFTSLGLLNSFGLDVRVGTTLYANFTVRNTFNYMIGAVLGASSEGYRDPYQYKSQNIRNQVGNDQFYSGLVTSIGLKYLF